VNSASSRTSCWSEGFAVGEAKIAIRNHGNPMPRAFEQLRAPHGVPKTLPAGCAKARLRLFHTTCC